MRITCILASLLVLVPAVDGQTIFGLDHTALGGAATTAGGVCPDCTLTVSNIGASGDDGVRVDVGRPRGFRVSFGDETDPAVILDGSQVRITPRSTQGAIGDVISSDLGDEVRSVGAFFHNSTTFRLTAVGLDGEVVFDQPGNPIGTAVLTAAMPTTVRTWVSPDGNIVIEHRYAAPTRVTPSGGPDLFATAIQFISEATTPLAPDALALVDLRFRGEPTRTITDEAVALFGHDFRALGSAAIEPSVSPGERVLVPTFGAGGNDGVWIDLGDSSTPQFNPDGVPIRAKVNLSAQGTAPTEQIRFEASADFGGRGGQTAMSVELHRNGAFWDVIPDASAVGSASVRVELFLGPSLVTVFTRTGTIATVEARPASVAFEIPGATSDAVAAELTLPFAGPIDVPGGGIFTADRMRIVSENHTRKPNFFDGLFLTGRDLQSIEIAGVEVTTVLLPEGFVFGTPTFALGRATFAPSGGGGGLIASNIGSSGEDGVAGNTVAMEEITLVHEGLILDAADQVLDFSALFETTSAAGGGGTGVGRVGGKMHLEDVSLGIVSYERDPSHGPDALVEVYNDGVYQGGAVVPADQPVAQIEVPAGGLAIESFGVGPAGVRTKLVDNLDIFIIPTVNPDGIVGNEIRIGPADTADRGGLITRYELRAAGVSSIEVNDVRFFKSRTGHSVVFDDANGSQPVLRPIPGLPDAYRVFNIGRSGLDGIIFEPEQSEAPSNPPTLTSDGAFQWATHAAAPLIVSAPGQAVAFDVTLKRGVDPDLFFPNVHTVQETASGRERIIEISADLTPLAPTSSRAEFLFEGEIVAIEPNFTAGLLATVPADPAIGAPKVVVRGWDASHRLNRGRQTRTFAATLRFDPVVAIPAGGVLPVTIDSITITEDNFDPSVVGVGSLTIRGTDLGDFAVDTGRTRGYPALLFGRPVVPLFNPQEFRIAKSISWEQERQGSPVGASFELGGASGAACSLDAARRNGSIVLYDVDYQGGGAASVRSETFADRIETGVQLDGLPAPDQLRIASLLGGQVQQEVTLAPPFPAVLATSFLPPAAPEERRPLLIVAEDIEGEARVLPFRLSWPGSAAPTQLPGGGRAFDADAVEIEYIYQNGQTDLDFLIERASVAGEGFDSGELVVEGLGLLAHEVTHAALGRATLSPSGVCPDCTLTAGNIGASGDDGVVYNHSGFIALLPYIEQSAPLVLTNPGTSLRFEPIVRIDGLTGSWGSYEIKEGGNNEYIHSLPTRIGRGETLIQLLVGDDVQHSYIVFGDGVHGFVPEPDDHVIVGYEFGQGTAPDGLGRVKIKFPALVEFHSPDRIVTQCDGVSAEHLGSGETLEGIEATRVTGRHLPPFAITSPAAPGCPCERTGDDPVSVDVFDLLEYLNLWFAGDPGAELTGDDPATIDVFDLLAFLDCWFSASGGGACP